MAAFIASLRRDIPLAFESKKYLDAKAKIIEDTESKKKSLFQDLTELSLKRGFGFEETPVGFGLAPLKAGHPMTDEQREALTEQEQQELTERRKTLEGEIREFHVRIHGLEKEAEHQLRLLDHQLVANLLEGRYETMRRAYLDLPRSPAISNESTRTSFITTRIFSRTKARQSTFQDLKPDDPI
jgi:translation elongation factor EF-1beta